MNLSRWLCQSPQEKTISESKTVLRIQKLAAIVPPDSQLPATSKERSFLRALIKRYQLQDASPVEPTYTAFKQFLQEGEYD
jgi:hypothetical protein